MMTLLLQLGGVAAALAFLGGIAVLIFAKSKYNQAQRFFDEAVNTTKNIKRDIENERRESLLRLKDELHKRRSEFDLDMKRERLELERFQSKLNAKYETLEKKEQRIEELTQEIQQKERNLSRANDRLLVSENKIKAVYAELIAKLESITGMTRDEARKELYNTLDEEVRMSSQKWIQKVEEEARQTAKDKSNNIVVTAMQRYIADQVAPHSSGIVHLPSEDMKGRIIGKEGRNIKALEMATGMEFVIGDIPEIITISGFNPIRREVARRALEKLITDGRINPTRIEETVGQCEKEIDEMVQEMGKDVTLELNIQGLHPEIMTLLGKLFFRTSFSQNVLMHSKEVGLFSRMIAEELGLDGTMALRAGLLHDIGKAVSAEVEGPHALIGGDIAKRCGEDPLVVNAIAAHHEEIIFASIYSPIIMIADTISASRPGARRETLSAYIKRLEKLEDIACSFEGVKKSYALQAGREVRIIVEEEMLDDDAAATLARNIARKIELEMAFPGQIKVNVIREKRSIEYAR
ncbi:MAG TPA: ribonuclease Y [Candidatus Babeliales bacterium]|nr:ribonuclease Y [Candidatus Babeliales bacterium]